MKKRFTIQSAARRSHPNSIDMPYICMPVRGRVDRIVDKTGAVLPDDWTGLCVTAVSTKDYWLISSQGGRRMAEPVGRFSTVAEAMATIHG